MPHIQNASFTPSFSKAKQIDLPDQETLTRRVKQFVGPLEDVSYLIKRNINPDVIADPIFKGRIASFQIKNHSNLSFNCYNGQDQFVTTCQRYFTGDKAVKQFPYFKDNNGINLSPSTIGTIWRSNLPEKPEMLLFSESPEDALSYYQLHKPWLEGKTLLVSSLGTFRFDQTKLISSLCQEHEISKVIIANDNDTAGTRFDLMALCAIQPAGSSISPILNASCSLIENQQHQHLNKLHFHFEFSNQQFVFAEKLFSHIDNALIKNDSRLAFSDGLFKTEDGKWNFDLFCKNDFTHTEDLRELIFLSDKSSFFSNHFLIDKPNDLTKPGENKRSIMKDWNEFLQYYAGDIISSNKKIDFFTKSIDNQIQLDEKKKSLKCK